MGFSERSPPVCPSARLPVVRCPSAVPRLREGSPSALRCFARCGVGHRSQSPESVTGVGRRSRSPESSPRRGVSSGFSSYVTNRDIFDKSRVPVTGAIFHPFRMGASPVSVNTPLRCLLAKFFIFIFFILAHGVQSLILGHF